MPAQARELMASSRPLLSSMDAVVGNDDQRMAIDQVQQPWQTLSQPHADIRMDIFSNNSRQGHSVCLVSYMSQITRIQISHFKFYP